MDGVTAALGLNREPFELEVDGLPAGALRVLSFRGREAMNELYSFDVSVAAPNLDERTVEQALGRRATLLLQGASGHTEHVHGVVAAVAAEGVRERRVPLFRLRVVPRLFLLGHRVTCRILQDATIVDIVDGVLAPHGIPHRWELDQDYPRRVYCVQYHESDLAFVLGMLAEEGVYLRFDQSDAADREGPGEVVVFGDAPQRIPPIAGGDRLPYREWSAEQALRSEEEHVGVFRSIRVVATTQALLRDFDFTHPQLDDRSLSEPVAPGSPDLKGRLPASLGVYEHRMGYEEPDFTPRNSGTYLEQLRASSAQHEGESRSTRLRPGSSFELIEHVVEGTDGRYCVTRVEHQGTAPELASGRDVYSNRFACVRAEVPFRPPRPPRQLRQVTETATVVGPAGEEIYADQHGRVKVQFHWDLDGKNDERSSCWLRLALPWAGPAWGFQFIPRIGMEVVVTFLGGDLDRPLITGCVYNAINTPSYLVPSEVTRSGIKTRTTPGGDGYNELSFDDRKGSEQVRLRAQRNLDEAVIVDHSTEVGRNQTLRVVGNQTTQVLGAQSVGVTGARSVHVDGPLSVQTLANRSDVTQGDAARDTRGNEESRVGGNRIETVEGEALTHIRGDRSVRVEGASLEHIGTEEEPRPGEVFAFGDYGISSAASIRIRAEDSITLECGESSIELTRDGIRIGGRSVRTVASELASMQSKGPAVVATDEIDISAKAIHLHGEDSLLSLTKSALLKSGTKTTVLGGGAGLGLAGDATLAGGKVIVASKESSLVLDADAHLDGGGRVLLNCGGANGGVSADDRDPKKLGDPRDRPMKPLKVRVLDAYLEPLPKKKYLLVVEGDRYDAETSPAGQIEVEVPEHAKLGHLTVWPGEYPDGERLNWKVVIHDLPPPDSAPGARVRLTNLAYYVGPPVEVIDERLKAAIQQFQIDHKISPANGELNDPTVAMLKERHGH